MMLWPRSRMTGGMGLSTTSPSTIIDHRPIGLTSLLLHLLADGRARSLMSLVRQTEHLIRPERAIRRYQGHGQSSNTPLDFQVSSGRRRIVVVALNQCSRIERIETEDGPYYRIRPD